MNINGITAERWMLKHLRDLIKAKIPITRKVNDIIYFTVKTRFAEMLRDTHKSDPDFFVNLELQLKKYAKEIVKQSKKETL